ncbi:MAG: hypothetical protein HWE13_10910 [Gammaproteobacteria bacterium]|nr:hypothetical protein [Gammaproteobacteria bacterium]
MKVWLSVLLIGWLLMGCKDKVGGPCEYQTFSQPVVVGERKEAMVELIAGDEVYTVPASRIEFKVNRGQSVLLVFERITKGTCTPFNIIAVKPLP